MDNLVSLGFTLVVGLFILVGSAIALLTKNNDKFVHLSISIAFGVMITLCLIELLPEAYEIISESYSSFISIIIIIIGTLIGMTLLKFLDLFIPDHENHKTNTNLYHIGLVSSIALILHNIIEGMAVFSTTSTSINLGLLVSIGVGLHNIPLGMVIAATFYQATKNIKKTIFISIIISLSTFLGGLLMFIFSGNLINDVVLGILLCITLGMISYIVFFELLPKIINSKYHKINVIGILIGITILIISGLFGGH